MMCEVKAIMLRCVDQYILDSILNDFKKMTFVCSLCGSIVFPTAHIEDNAVSISKKSTVTYGKGNKVIRRDICSDCAEKM